MAILFNCQNCQQQLKVPDGSGGKKVRCPECEAVNVIPGTEQVAATPPLPPTPPPPATHRDDFDQSQNPFAPPRSTVEQPEPLVRGDLRSGRVEFGQVLEQAWQRFQPTLGKSALFGIAFVALGIISNLLGQTGEFAMAVFGDPILAGTLIVGGFFGQQLLNAAQQLFGKRYGLNVVRRAPDVLSNVFSLQGLLQIILFFLIVGVVFGVVAGLAAIPVLVGLGIAGGPEGTAFVVGVTMTIVLGVIALVGSIYFFMRIFLTAFFIVDQQMGTIQAMKASSEFMNGNCLATFLITLVSSMAVGLFGVCTCLVGFILALPFFEVVQAMVYLQATGQDQASAPHESS